MKFGEDAARRLEHAYMTPDVVKQREATLELFAAKPGEHIIDIGSGPGFLCESLAREVGPDGRVLGVDVSEDLLAAARGRNTFTNLGYEPGDATKLPAADAAFDAAISTQVFEYVSDCDMAIREMHRVLRPQGRALVVATDWGGVVWHSSDRERMARMMRAWESHCADPRLPRTLVARVRTGGFDVQDVRGYTIVNTRAGDDTYSGNMLKLMASFVGRRKSLEEAEIDAWLADLRALDEQGRYFFAATRFMMLATKRG
jgi:2-polyprenyl-3-methyl-5-hydroxy-6-metoxy-1,4-benzoquinol methylase